MNGIQGDVHNEASEDVELDNLIPNLARCARSSYSRKVLNSIIV